MKTKLRSLLVILIQLPVLAFSQDITVFFDDISTKHVENAALQYYKTLPKDTVRNRIIEKARQYIGVNYKWGQSNENGFDCSGYVKYVYGHFGYLLPHSSYAQYNASRRLTENKARPGDLVFFVTRGERISHVGIYLGDHRFIHAPSTGKQIRIESLDTGFFRKTLAGFGSIF
jgi:cell wall-associated NlpC family hydrolase